MMGDSCVYGITQINSGNEREVGWFPVEKY